MTIDTNMISTMTEANQNFSKVARLVDEKGAAVIMKNNAPKYIVIEFSKIPESAEVADKAAVSLAKKLISDKK